MSEKRTYRNREKSLASTLPGLTREAFKKRGFSEYRLINEWGSIVGETLASRTSPIKLVFEPNKQEAGTLHIQVISGWALELQHQQPQILDRIATFFGYRAVARLVLLQVSVMKPRPRLEPPPPVNPMEPARLTELTHAGGDEQLREALHALGSTLFSQKQD